MIWRTGKCDVVITVCKSRRWSSFGPTQQRIENRTDYEDALIRFFLNPL